MTSQEPQERKQPFRLSELILSVVTILYAIFAIAFHYPKMQTVLMPVCTVWNFLGLQQRWSLFAPGIPSFTVHLIGIVTLADGAKVIFEPPHQSNRPFFERNLYNRYLKWGSDYAPSQPYKPHLPKLCSHIMQEFNFPDNPPKSCALIQEWAPISNPKQRVSPRDKMPERWWHVPFYRQEYSEEDSNAESNH